MKSRLRRIERAARGDLDWLELRDGSRFYFEPMQAHRDLFLERMDGFRALAGPDLSEGAPATEPVPPPAPPTTELRRALAKATPESLRRFEERYGSAEPESGVIHDDGRVTIRRMALDGSVSTTVLEGEEAERGRRRAREE